MTVNVDRDGTTREWNEQRPIVGLELQPVTVLPLPETLGNDFKQELPATWVVDFYGVPKDRVLNVRTREARVGTGQGVGHGSTTRVGGVSTIGRTGGPTGPGPTGPPQRVG